ncbi:MAG: hypothetical protein WC887_01305 [Candidatus Paceibacterota bacterium]|jgi:drug/metabolite transporter (DMT)-like permease
MKIGRIICFILAVVFGVFMIVYGEIDDSPGGQFLGLLSVIAGSIGMIKSKRK